MTNARIWIVEDNNADVFLIELALSRIGFPFEKTIVGDGERAVRMIRACQEGLLAVPDMLLLDLRLPKRDGKEVLQAIQANPVFAKAGVAIFSSSPDGFTPDDHKVTFIQKPAELEAFLRVVTRTVKHLLSQDGRSASTRD